MILMIVPFVIGTAFFLSRKLYRDLKARESPWAVPASILVFLAILLGTGSILFISLLDTMLRRW